MAGRFSPGQHGLFVLLSLVAAGFWTWSRSTYALAQDKTALSWVREPGAGSCIAAPELGRRVESLIGPVLSSAADAQVSVEGRIAPAGSGFEANIVVTDSAGVALGERKLTSVDQDCRAFDEQLTFVIAITIDPDAVLAELPATLAADHPEQVLLAELEAAPPQVVNSPPASKPRAPVALPQLTSSPKRPVTLHPRTEAGMIFGLGQLPAAAWALRAGLGLSFLRWSVLLHGSLWLSQEVSIDPEKAAQLKTFDLGASACPRLWRTPEWALELCAGLQAARLSAAPEGFIGLRRQAWMAGPVLALGFERHIASVAWAGLHGGITSQWPRHRLSYTVLGEEKPLFEQPAVAGWLGARVGLRF